MLIGVRFEIPNKYFRFLHNITRNIDVKKYWWGIVEWENEIYIEKGGGALFCKKIYTGIEFESLINICNYYTIFANIQVYENEINEIEIIKNHDDFNRSKLAFQIICTDNSWVDIYSKDKNIIESFRSCAIENDYKKVEYIDSENDIRDSFHSR